MPRSRSSSASPASAQLFDELLVVMVKRGDKRAFQRLYERWNTRIVRAARRYTGSGDLASDLAQECWIAIWKGIAGLRDPARFRSYAFGVLHRRGADHLRKVIRERERATPGESVPDTPQAMMPSESLAITQAFASLPPDQRLAAHLHFVEGLTLTEIAEVQDIPTGTAKSRLFHARRKLKAALSDTPEGDHS